MEQRETNGSAVRKARRRYVNGLTRPHAPTFSLSADTRLAVERYTAVSVENYRNGSITKAQHEEARSYAVEALTAILRDNPEWFDYFARIEEVRQQKLQSTGVAP